VPVEKFILWEKLFKTTTF